MEEMSTSSSLISEDPRRKGRLEASSIGGILASLSDERAECLMRTAQALMDQQYMESCLEAEKTATAG